MSQCIFCNDTAEQILFNHELYRIILVQDENYPGFLRIITNQHIIELSDLSDNENLVIYQAVIRCEKIIRQLFHPDKINLASLGNITSHVHWHIIPRYINDQHFPNPIWGAINNPDYQPSDKLKVANITLLKQFKSLFNNEN